MNIVVLTLDTTRWDRIGAYGDRAAQTPNLDRLAGEGVLFEQAITSAPLTLPAHSTLFTSLLPPRHGVRDNGGYVLDPRHPTLATVLKQGGWNTGAFIGAFVLDSKFGLDQGFDTYHDKFDVSKYRSVSLGDVARTGGEVVDHALPWLDAHAGSPFFAWLHFYDAHSPYQSAGAVQNAVPRRAVRGRDRVRGLPGRSRPPVARHEGADRPHDRRRGRGPRRKPQRAPRGHARPLHLRRHHPHPVHRPGPVRQDRRGRRVQSAVRAEDVMPTLLDLVGQRGPDGMQGRSLVPLMTGAAEDLELDAYSESLYALQSLRVERAEVAALGAIQIHLDDDSRAV